MLTAKPGKLFPAINQPSVYCSSLVAMRKESFCQPGTNESGNQSSPLKELKLGCISFQKEFLFICHKGITHTNRLVNGGKNIQTRKNVAFVTSFLRY